MTSIPMELPEAQRRIEKAMIEAGYQTVGRWAEVMHKDESGHVTSLALVNMPDTRAVLWPTGTITLTPRWIKGGETLVIGSDRWSAMISVAVDEEGEFPLTGARLMVTEEEGLLWKPKPFSLLKDRIEQVRLQVRRWDLDMASPLVDKAMMRLALDYLRAGRVRLAGGVLLGALRGEVSVATISESLSIVQSRWAQTREARTRSALIWSAVFK